MSKFNIPEPLFKISLFFNTTTHDPCTRGPGLHHTSLAETAKTDPQKAVVTAVLQKEEQSAEEMLDSEARGGGGILQYKGFLSLLKRNQSRLLSEASNMERATME